MRNLAIFLTAMGLILWANSIPYEVGGWNMGGALSLTAGWLFGAGFVYDYHLRYLKKLPQANVS